MSSKMIEKEMDKIKEKDRNIERFSDILDELSSTEEKKKLLWKEIYENAITDRDNANILFTDLLIQTRGDTANHSMFGGILSKYIERMSKSNDQILRLAELVAKELTHDAVSVDDIYSKIKED